MRKQNKHTKTYFFESFRLHFVLNFVLKNSEKKRASIQFAFTNFQHYIFIFSVMRSVLICFSHFICWRCCCDCYLSLFISLVNRGYWLIRIIIIKKCSKTYQHKTWLNAFRGACKINLNWYCVDFFILINRTKTQTNFK